MSAINWAVLHKNKCRASSIAESTEKHIKEEESSQIRTKPEDNSHKTSKQAEAKTGAQPMGVTLIGQKKSLRIEKRDNIRTHRQQQLQHQSSENQTLNNFKTLKTASPL